MGLFYPYTHFQSSSNNRSQNILDLQFYFREIAEKLIDAETYMPSPAEFHSLLDITPSKYVNCFIYITLKICKICANGSRVVFLSTPPLESVWMHRNAERASLRQFSEMIRF